MKTEKPTKHYLNDKDRDAVLKLITCGLSTDEIAGICKCSTSTISYIRQAHTACINRDWTTLQKLSTTTRPTVDWAMKVTGTDKVFAEEFKEEQKPEEPVTGPTVDVTPAPAVVTREEFLALYASVQDICNLLIDIRDTLK